jgi:hypothetical protein
MPILVFNINKRHIKSAVLGEKVGTWSTERGMVRLA